MRSSSQNAIRRQSQEIVPPESATFEKDADGHVHLGAVKCPFCCTTVHVVFGPTLENKAFTKAGCRHDRGAVAAGSYEIAVHFSE